MPEKLDPETKRLRSLTPAQMADEVGLHKAEIAAADERLEAIKLECRRRNLRSANGTLFDITMTPPGERKTLDKEVLGTVFGVAFIEHFSKTTMGENWTLRCVARKPGIRAQQAG